MRGCRPEDSESPSIMKFLRLVLTLACAALPCWVHAQTVIGVSVPKFDDRFLTIVREAIVAHAGTMDGVKLDVQEAKENAKTQAAQVDAFVAKKVGALIVIPVDTATTKGMSEAARAARIPIVYVNRKPAEPMGNGAVYVGSNSLLAGKMQMEYLAKKTEGKGQVAILVGMPAHEAAQERTRGVKQVCAGHPGIKVVAEEVGNWQRKEGAQIVSGWLKKGVAFDVIAANNDEMALGALDALAAAGLAPGKVLVAGIDATPDALAAVSAGKMVATVLQNAKGQGRGALDVAVKLAKGDTSLPKEVMIPYELVTLDNLAKYQSK